MTVLTSGIGKLSFARLLLILVWPLVVAGSCAANFDSSHKAEKLALIAADGVAHEFTVEIMRTPRELWTGLRWRESLPEGAGMLFDLGSVRPAAFTMSDTLIALDMLFIGADGRIVNIAARARPGDPGPFKSDGAVRAVLELNAGTAEKLGLKPGDRVEYPLFVRAKEPVPR